MSTNVRPPAVAGTFYPAGADQLRAQVQRFLDGARSSGPVPKALIVPHAGYPYSGPIAASGYARLAAARRTIRRVVLIGPTHRARVAGLATSSADYFATPLGDVPIDRDAVSQVLSLPQVHVADAAHAQEHCLEVHLPFLQVLLDQFRIVPLLASRTTTDEIAEVFELLWGGPETLIVISSDLSHYHSYEQARRIDLRTSTAIVQLNGQDVRHEQACGYLPIRGLIRVVSRNGLQAQAVDLRNSGDTAGTRSEVVGYGAFAFATESEDFTNEA